MASPSNTAYQNENGHSKTEENANASHLAAQDTEAPAEPPSAPDINSSPPTPSNLSTSRLITILCSLGIGLFLSSLETSIVATALVSVAADLGYFGAANWIVVAYFLTYTGFMIVYARLSDVYGRKALLLTAIALFGLFSLGCGLAQSMTSLIILRAFQGMGGSGIYSMVFAVAPEVLPLHAFGWFSGLIGAVYASSSILGPILGGAIASGAGTSWRWIFLLNVPPCCVIFVLLFFAYPKNAPRITDVQSLKQVDGIGLSLVLAASILLIFPLEQAENAYPWSSGVIIGTFIASGVCWILFIAWQLYLPKFHAFKGLPAFPLRLLGGRVIAAAYLTGFLAGAPFTATLILLPQRYQIVNALPPLQAGLRMLPLLLSSAFGSVLGGVGPRIRHGTYVFLLLGQSLIILGFGLLSSIGSAATVPAAEYGYLVILGVGFGCSLSTLLVLCRVEVSPQDSAILMASLTQVRVLGGCIGLAVANALISSKTTTITALVSPTVTSTGRDTASLVGQLPATVQSQVRQAFGDAFILETRVMLGLGALAGLVSLATWNPRARSLEEVKAEQTAWEETKARQGVDAVQ